MNYLVNAIGRKGMLGVFVFSVLSFLFYTRGDAAGFERYADFAEVAFGIFVIGNAAEHFAKKPK